MTADEAWRVRGLSCCELAERRSVGAFETRVDDAVGELRRAIVDALKLGNHLRVEVEVDDT